MIFDNARIDPEDTELKETIKNALKKLETSVAPAMPCKIVNHCGSGASNRQPNIFQTAGLHTRPRALNFATPSVKFATDVQLVKKFASMQRRRCIEHLKLTTEVQEDVAAHRDRTRRVTNEHAKAEGHVNDGIGSLGRALQAAAKATHSLTCGVPDLERNDLQHPREATELIGAWQDQPMSGQPTSGPPSEHGEVISAERQS